MPADVVIHPAERLKGRFARLTEEAARASIADRGAFSLAIPGGSAAEVLLPALVAAPIDWTRLSVFFVDERMVPPESADSNFRVAKESWLDKVPLSPARVHRMRGEDADPARAARDYAAALRDTLGDSPRLDLVLLGVGADGHVASLFPGHRLLRAWDRDVAALEDAPKPPARRMTLTLRTLTAARRILVFATGSAKSAAIADAIGNEDSELPLALATLGSAPVTFLLDPDAAAAL
jgi:6-phosphogluconolactonase